ncbi:MAG: MmcQ/YjbR family DNA-binding protein [Propionibacteriales bacterium]|jgi:hypothetical protein|nr:MmcQ/YjbR family DNA-binding protein [Propionibacteriales bacterium]
MKPEPPQPTGDATATDPRAARRSGQDLLDSLADRYLSLPDVTQERMFGSDGLAVRGKFFAFVGRDGQLILKLPADQAAALCTDDLCQPVQMGARKMREWISIAQPTAGQDPSSWAAPLADAHAYVDRLTPGADNPALNA